MADYLHNDVYDNGLAPLTTIIENLYICSALPATFAEASSTYKLGVKASPSISGPSDRSVGGGREVTVAAITTGGSVTANGTAAYFALTDDSASKLIAAGDLAAPQVVTSGNTFTLTSFKIGIPAPTT